MKHFVQRLEEYSENPEAKATGAVTVGLLSVAYSVCGVQFSSTVGLSICGGTICSIMRCMHDTFGGQRSCLS